MSVEREVSTITCYEDMKGSAKWSFGIVRDHSRSSAMSPFDTAHTTRLPSLF